MRRTRRPQITPTSPQTTNSAQLSGRPQHPLKHAASRLVRQGYLGLAVVLTLAACGEADPGGAPVVDEVGADKSPGEEPGEQLGTVTVMLTVPEDLTFFPADLGPSLGDFNECGITAENVAGGADTIGPSLIAGEIDIGLLAAPLAAGLIMKGVPGKVVANLALPWGQVLIVSNALAEAGLQTPEDIPSVLGDESLTFGVSAFGSLGDFSVRRIAQQLGWTEGEQYDVVPLGGVHELTAGLEAGAIDAFTFSRTVAYTTQAGGVGNVIEDVVPPDAVGPVIIASDSFIAERPDALQAYMECLFSFVEELVANPDTIRTVAVEEWDYDPDVVEQVLGRLFDSWSDNGSARQEELSAVEEAVVFLNDDLDEAPINAWWRYWREIGG